MAFDLVQYFTAQIKLQKPQLFSTHTDTEKQAHIEEVNALALGQLISLWKQDRHKLYQEVLTSDPLYIQGIARHLTTSAHNQSNLRPSELESSISEVLSLQLTELKQLDETGSFGENGLTELLLGQIEHLSGQAADWVWSTNQLTELLGSKPAPVQDISLEATIQEFNQMVHQAQPSEHDAIATVKNGYLLFMPKGEGKTISGLDLPTFFITRNMGDSHRWSDTDGADDVSGVTVFYYDNDKAERQKVTVGMSDENTRELRNIQRDEKSAKRVAQSEFNRIKAKSATFSYKLAYGKPDLIPEMQVQFMGLKSEIDDIIWLGTRVVHTLSADNGFVTDVELEVYLPDADDLSELVDEDSGSYTGILAYYKDGKNTGKVIQGDQTTPKRLTYLYKNKQTATTAATREYKAMQAEKNTTN